MESLSGQVAVVTGAAGGIGRAICRALAAEGAAVAGWDLVAGDDGGGSARFEVDVTSSTSVEAAYTATVDRLGEVGIVVNNAGIDVIAPFLDTDEDDWQRIIAVNLTGIFRVCKHALPPMIERVRAGRGDATIINVGSDAGRVGSSGEAVYSATKGGIIAFTKTLAREHARDGVTVNCVCPGPTDTPLLDQVATVNQRLYDGLKRAVPLGRIGEPEDIAGVVAFLASPAAAFMTGQTVSVSGGLTMS